jgi:Fe-S-cluster containining protein
MQNGEKFRIPTLVASRNEVAACKFLKDNRCTIHSVAPFACAFFDEHEPKAIADRKSGRGLSEIASDLQKGGLYARIWRALDRDGRRAIPPEVARQQMRDATHKSA